MPQVAAEYQKWQDVGLDIMIILGEANYEGAKPTLQYCKNYAAQHQAPLDKVFLDFGNEYGAWETTMSKINPYLGPGGQFSLPWEAVLDGDNMEYIQASTYGPYSGASAIIDALNAALSD